MRNRGTNKTNRVVEACCGRLCSRHKYKSRVRVTGPIAVTKTYCSIVRLEVLVFDWEDIANRVAIDS